MPASSPLLPVESAIERIFACVALQDAETLPLEHTLGRVLAHPLHARHPSPPFSNSAMDGFGVSCADLVTLGGSAQSCDLPGVPSPASVTLPIAASIAAGGPPPAPLLAGHCVRIMTGAPVPPGVDAVIMREEVEDLGSTAVFRARPRMGQHIRNKGSEYQIGDLLLQAGSPLLPGAIGQAAADGHHQLAVRRRPRVVILSTGDELVPPGSSLGPGQRWSSNAPTLCALVREAGGEPIDMGILPDNLEATKRGLQSALEHNPALILSSGGVSMGDHDHLRPALLAAGGSLDLWRIRVKPGKPLAFGHLAGVPLLGLPGNPSACVVTFRLFVYPAIQHAMGVERPQLPIIDARFVADRPLERSPGRSELVEVSLQWGPQGLEARRLHTPGSGAVGAAARASGYALLAHDARRLEPGDMVPVLLARPLHDWSSPLAALRWGGRA